MVSFHLTSQWNKFVVFKRPSYILYTKDKALFESDWDRLVSIDNITFRKIKEMHISRMCAILVHSIKAIRSCFSMIDKISHVKTYVHSSVSNLCMYVCTYIHA